jgi:hypothetical protein
MDGRSFYHSSSFPTRGNTGIPNTRFWRREYRWYALSTRVTESYSSCTILNEWRDGDCIYWISETSIQESYFFGHPNQRTKARSTPRRFVFSIFFRSSVYRIQDFEDGNIDGTFYQQELQKVNKDGDKAWKIEKILKRQNVEVWNGP